MSSPRFTACLAMRSASGPPCRMEAERGCRHCQPQQTGGKTTVALVGCRRPAAGLRMGGALRPWPSISPTGARCCELTRAISRATLSATSSEVLSSAAWSASPIRSAWCTSMRLKEGAGTASTAVLADGRATPRDSRLQLPRHGARAGAALHELCCSSVPPGVDELLGARLAHNARQTLRAACPAHRRRMPGKEAGRASAAGYHQRPASCLSTTGMN